MCLPRRLPSLHSRLTVRAPEATGGGGALISNPIGTGPYKLEAAEGDSVMTRNDDYWGEGQRRDLVFCWQEGAARLLELQSGTVDGIDNLSPDDFETIKNDSTLALYPARR